ncbi:hypothetical protein ABL78_4191 [Leptomonas seymouri]|uniref:Calponin-homology (CH) domain-containing protein n=1 Tax=Leptomonas seymouri TaxID=5684 RepID=A0A0N1I3T9_LEPSE|nr:hypothetical protein ABL78_4191 [Leptomonas seymouri]|eukprot:KPI86721.1 hypothetical protein ABL78_4191 [Leptomonas seymouri]
MTAPTLLGKAELLAWAADVTGITPCEKYGDLKDGLVYLSLARELFPQDIDSAIVRLQRRGARDPAKNWSLLSSSLRRHNIPLHLCNRQAVERGHTRHCFNLLVLFYFLLRLARGDQFSVDFAQPVDPQLAAFLQSPDSVFAVERTRGTGASATTASEAGPSIREQEKMEEERERRGGMPISDNVVTRLSSPPSASSLSPCTQRPYSSFSPGVASSQLAMEYATHTSRMDLHERHPAEAALPFSRHPLDFHTNTTTPRGPIYAHGKGPKEMNAVGSGIQAWRVSPHHALSQLRWNMTPSYAGDTELVVGAAPLAPPLPSSTSSSLLTENRLLREELHYVKAVSQLLMMQQRGLEASTEMRTAATLQGELAKGKLSHLHDLRQLEVALNASSPSRSSLAHNSHYSDPQWMALEHRAEVAEKTAAQLYDELNRNHQTYDATLQQLQQAFRSIDIITEAAQQAASTLPSARTGSASHEEAVMDAMMAQLECVPAVFRDAVRTQVRALLLTLRTLRVSNERLHMDVNERAARSEGQGYSTSDTLGQAAVSSATSSFSPQSAHPSDIASLCEEAQFVCQAADPAVQHACHFLVQMVEELQGKLEAAQHDAEEWRRRYHKTEAIAAPAEAVRQRARTSHAAQGGQELYDRFTMFHTQGDAAYSLSPQYQKHAEALLLEAQRLYDRVAEVLVRTFSTPGTENMKWANEQLVSLLHMFLQQRQQSAAAETALAEQCESAAPLRQESRQRIEKLDCTSADLAKSELRRGGLEQRCAALEKELRSQKKQPCAGKHGVVEQEGDGQRASLGNASPSAVLAQLSKAPASPSAKHTSTHPPPAARIHSTTSTSLPESNMSAAGPTPSLRVISPYQPGALRSPSPSSEDESQRRGGSSHLGDRSDIDFRDALETPPPLSSRPQMTKTTALEASHRRQVSFAAGVMSVPQAITATPTTTSTKTKNMAAGHAAAPSPLLSAAELERRKQEILRRFNVD